MPRVTLMAPGIVPSRHSSRGSRMSMKVTPGWPCSFMTSASGIVSIWLSASSTICWTDFLILSGIELPPMPICTFRPRQVEASETTDFEILAREAELREALFEVIRQQRLAQQVGGGAVVVLPLRFVAQIVPIFQSTVATTKPQERHEFGLFLLAQRIDEGHEFLLCQIVGMRLEHRRHTVIGGVGTRIGIAHHVLGVELARLDDDEADALGRNRQGWISHHTLPWWIGCGNAGPAVSFAVGL